MKMKKLIAIIFNIMLVCSLLVFTNVSASAQTGAFALEFSLTNESGESVITVNPGDEITVYFNMKRTDLSANYNTNGFQNYIHYDLSFFEFVDGSITCFDTGSASAKKMNSITYGEIVQCQNMANGYSADFVFCTFKLKVIAAGGSGIVYNDEVYAFDTSFQQVSVTKVNLKVSICKHNSKTFVPAKAPTCTEKGWDAYQDCDDCSLFFDANGENIIDEITYYPATGHSQTTQLCFDEQGHWFACANCDEKLEFAAHSGGEATCSEKAVCSTCNQAYGELDSSNHEQTATMKYDENGHWYACANCDEKLEYAAHSGGEATCSQKAVCSTCNQAYGELDGDNHGDLNVVNYDENGHWFTCSDCGDDLVYAAHSGGEATCSQKAVCSTCNQAYGELDGDNHGDCTLEYNDVAHWYNCPDCDEVVDFGEHTGGEVTCSAKAICSICNQAYGELDSNNHSQTQAIIFDEQGHWFACADCGTALEYAAHSGGEATCSAKAICSVCEAEYGDLDASNHGGNDNNLSYDENGHWSVCSACGERNYAEHSGGSATCGHKATCDVCKQPYGNIDPENHANTYVLNYKFAWFFGNGYSGDVYCSECNELAEAGEVISMFDVGRWPWWVLLISIPLFPIILIVWIFIY